MRGEKEEGEEEQRVTDHLQSCWEYLSIKTEFSDAT